MSPLIFVGQKSVITVYSLTDCCLCGAEKYFVYLWNDLPFLKVWIETLCTQLSRQESCLLPILCHGVSYINSVVNESKLLLSLAFISNSEEEGFIKNKGIFVHIHDMFRTSQSSPRETRWQIHILSVTEAKRAETLPSLPHFLRTAKCCWCLRLGQLIGLAGSVDRCHGDSVLPPCERPLDYLPSYLLGLTMWRSLASAIYV